MKKINLRYSQGSQQPEANLRPCILLENNEKTGLTMNYYTMRYQIGILRTKKMFLGPRAGISNIKNVPKTLCGI